MSGHSKWSKIKRKKEVTDAKKSAAFSKFSAEILSAVRQGGSDPAGNALLRDVVARAKKAGVPQANIDRLLSRDAETNIQSVTYEAFGPSGAGLIIKAQTDNPNRTVAAIRTLLKTHGGSLGAPNSVTWKFSDNFTPKYPLKLDQTNKQQLDDLLTALQNHPDIQDVYTDAA